MKSIFILMFVFGVGSNSASASNLLDKAKAAKEAVTAAAPTKPAAPAEPEKPGLTDQLKEKAAQVEGEFNKGKAQVKDMVSSESAPAEKAPVKPAKKAKKSKAKKSVKNPQ